MSKYGRFNYSIFLFLKRGFFAITIACILISNKSEAATYIWQGADGALWSATTSWDLGALPGSADTATFNSVTSNRTAYFNSAVPVANRTISALSLSEATAGVSNVLRVNLTGLTVSNDISIGNGSDATALSVIWLDPSLGQRTAYGSGVAEGTSGGSGGNISLTVGTGNGLMTLNKGGLLVMDGYCNGSSYTSTLSGNLLIDGGKLLVKNPYNPTTAGSAGNAMEATVSKNLTMNSGTLSIEKGSQAYPRLHVSGDFTIHGGTIDLGGTSGTYGPQILLYGANNSIDHTSAAVSINSVIQFYLYGANFSSTDVYIPYIGARSTGNATQTITFTTGSNVGSGTQFGGIAIGQATAGAVTTLKLGSDISSDFTTASPNGLQMAWGNSTAGNKIGGQIDLNGHAFTMVGKTWTPNRTISSSTVYWYVTSSSGDGTIVADAFNFGTAPVNVGYNVGLTVDAVGSASTPIITLKATKASTANNLGSGSISSKSVFWYAGDGTSTLTSASQVGNVKVGDSGVSSVLQLSSTIVANGGLTLVSGGKLDLNGNNFTVGSSGGVGANFLTSGSNTYLINSSSSVATFSFASATTIGKFSPGGDGAKGSLNVGMTDKGMNLDLANTTLLIDVLSDGSSDMIVLNGSVAVLFTGSTIQLNFLGGSNQSGTVEVFNNLNSWTGTPTIVSNWGGEYTFTIGELYAGVQSGYITYTALIPEPSTVALMVMGGSLALLAFIKRRKVSLIAS